ncbi:MAG: hypothetical protein JO250_06320 [Armatimonadetes bacterium]|nr:hypothetical protein [Armatimonadota bacterium]
MKSEVFDGNAENNDGDARAGNGISEVVWAQPVRWDKIRRLYENDARGVVDEMLVEDVGLALYLRCRSILTVMAAAGGQVACPRCEREGVTSTIVRIGKDNSAASRAEELRCARCGWWTTWGQYWQTYRNRQLYGAGGVEAFRTFLAGFDRARSARDKVHAIDRLIHSFHYNLKAGAKEHTPSRPAAANVIEGSLGEVVAFLDQLTYGDAVTEEMRRTRAAYEERLPHTWAGARYSPPK